MAVRAIIAFDHLPQNDTAWINYASHGMYRGADLSAQNTIVNGWLVSNATASGAERVYIPLAPYLAAPVNKIWIGYRCRVVLNPRGGAGLVYLNGTYVLLDSLMPLAGNTVYVEFSIDVTSGVVERWINGVKQANSAGPAGRSTIFSLEVKGSLNGRYDFRDFYICDDQGAAQGLPVGPLGPQVTIPITLDSAAATGWTTTPSGSTLLNALSEPGVIPTTNIATSVGTTPLTASLKLNATADLTIKAIELIAGGRSTTGATVAVAAKISQGGTDVAGPAVVAPITNYSYNLGLGVFHKSPSGAPWSIATVDATDLVLTPAA